jgi:hypothetical protein
VTGFARSAAIERPAGASPRKRRRRSLSSAVSPGERRARPRADRPPWLDSGGVARLTSLEIVCKTGVRDPEQAIGSWRGGAAKSGEDGRLEERRGGK